MAAPGVLSEMDRVRRSLYEETADYVVDVSSQGPDQVVQAILTEVGA